jgi:NAD(P)H-hydrate epimerase
VRIFLARPDKDFTPVPAHQLDIVRRMNVPVFQAGTIQTVEHTDLIVDGIIGYSLKGAPRGVAGDLIEWANAQQAPILALDVPSGIDTTTGTVFDPAIIAAATMTLALPKKGLCAQGVQVHVGELYLADISVPGSLYQEAFGLLIGPLFAKSDIIRLEPTRSG